MVASSDKDEKKWTKEEILNDIERIRTRLDNMEKKKEDLRTKRKSIVIFKNDYGKRCGDIPFPFMTFGNDDRYAAFMTSIMRNLEARFFVQ